MTFRGVRAGAFGFAIALAAAGDGLAQAPAGPVPAESAASSEVTGAVAAQPRPAATSGPRRPRGFRECTRDAQARRLRGMERRRFVYRCQVGSGRPLFRRRGPPMPPSAPGPTPPATGGAAGTR